MSEETKQAKPADEFMETAANIAMMWIDITPFAEALREQYLRGLREGIEKPDQSALDAAYERGRADMRAEILASLTGTATVKGKNGETIEYEASDDSLSVKVKPGADTEELAADAEPPQMQTVFSMIQAVLRDTPNITAREVYVKVCERWPGARERFPKFDKFGANISVALQDGRCTRDHDGRLSLTEDGESYMPPDRRAQQRTERMAEPPKSDPLAKVETEEPKVEAKPIEAPKLPSKGNGGSAPASGVVANQKFEIGHRSIMLTVHEKRVAEALLRAMQKNPGSHLDYNFLGLRGRGTGDSRLRLSDRDWLSDLFSGLEPKLRSIGLEVQHHAPYGYKMLEMPL